MINTSCFPVTYQDKYYKDVVNDSAKSNDEGLSKLAYVGGFVVGAASSRVEDIEEHTKMDDSEESNDKGNSNNSDNKRKRIYIMTLGVLAAYRGRGIGTKLIQSILDYYDTNKDSEELKDVVEISLHVQISNQDAIDFYTKRFGFIQGEQVDNYYNKRIDPPHCYRLYKTLR